MSTWTKLFRKQMHSVKTGPRLRLERLDDRSLPSITLPDGTVWIAPLLPPEQPAMPTEGPFTSTNTVVSPSVIADEPMDMPDPPKSITGTIGIDAKSTSSAEKGKFTPNGGKEGESTDQELVARTAYYMQYDGPTEFKAIYTSGSKKTGHSMQAKAP